MHKFVGGKVYRTSVAKVEIVLDSKLMLNERSTEYYEIG